MTVQSQVYRRTIENVNLEGFLFLRIWMGLRSLVISFRVDRWSRAKTRAKVSDLPLIVTLQTIFCSSFLFFFFLPFSFLPFLFVLFFPFFFLLFTAPHSFAHLMLLLLLLKNFPSSIPFSLTKVQINSVEYNKDSFETLFFQSIV